MTVLNSNNISVLLMGGLGNQMFQYAFIRETSLRRRCNFILDHRFLLDRSPRPNFTFRSYSLGMFNLSDHDVIRENYPPGKQYLNILYYLVFNRLRDLRFDLNAELYLERQSKTDLDCQNDQRRRNFIGYFQDAKYFAGNLDIIQRDFQLKNFIDEGRAQTEEVIEKKRYSVCLHVRRTDFLSTKDGVVAGIYYKRAVKYITDRVPKAQFIVFSDDVGWCRNEFFGLKNFFIVDDRDFKNPLASTVYLMRKCSGFICSNSTFSWWAAYLGGDASKIVVVPEQWNKSVDASGYGSLVQKHWVII